MGGQRPHIVSESVINSEAWRHFKLHRLTKNMRVQRMIEKYPERTDELKRYGEWLLQMGNGTLETKFKDLIEIPSQMVCASTTELESKVFDNFDANSTNRDYLAKRAIMSSKNDTIHEKNFHMIEQL